MLSVVPSAPVMADQNSDEGSEIEAGLGRMDNAQVAPRSGLAAALRSLNLEKLIDEPDWHDNEQPGFHERTAVKQYNFPNAESVGAVSASPVTETSSMAVSIHTHRSAVGGSISSSYTPSSRTPSLGSYPSVRSGSSVRTSRADSFLRQTVLEEDETGVPQAPVVQDAGGRLACPFSFLKCQYRSNDVDEWDMHSQSHLRGFLPKQVHCPFACDWSKSAEKGAEAWRQRIVHIIAEHADEEVDTASLPKASLIEHLWRHRIISDVQKKELLRYGRITGDISTSSSGPLQHNRSQRRRNRPSD